MPSALVSTNLIPREENYGGIFWIVALRSCLAKSQARKYFMPLYILAKARTRSRIDVCQIFSLIAFVCCFTTRNASNFLNLLKLILINTIKIKTAKHHTQNKQTNEFVNTTLNVISCISGSTHRSCCILFSHFGFFFCYFLKIIKTEQKIKTKHEKLKYEIVAFHQNVFHY